jgi:hypothetical protein
MRATNTGFGHAQTARFAAFQTKRNSAPDRVFYDRYFAGKKLLKNRQHFLMFD